MIESGRTGARPRPTRSDSVFALRVVLSGFTAVEGILTVHIALDRKLSVSRDGSRHSSPVGFRMVAAFGCLLAILAAVPCPVGAQLVQQPLQPTADSLEHSPDGSPKPWLDTLPPGGGLCAVLGDEPRATVERIMNSTSKMVYVQADREIDRQWQRAWHERGWLGTRIFTGTAATGRLGLADNLCDAVIVTGAAPAQYTEDELLRVISPGGLLVIAERARRKEFPDGMGRWTHPYHGPDNNPQADDDLARAPYLTQFLATPWYGPMPEVTVSSGGRVFKAFGHLAFKEREWPMLSTLLALNGYNGSELWRRELTPGFMIHRNTLVATDDHVYLADNRACQVIDAATGKLLDEIAFDRPDVDGPSWKWMAIRGHRLYALLGPPEPLHPVHRGERAQTGWPWTTVKATYGDFQAEWGFGRTLLALDLESRELLWKYTAESPIDSRAVCMNADRIFLYSHGESLAALQSEDGRVLWETRDPEILEAIGEHDPADNPRLGYTTSAYAKCNRHGVYFAGPQRKQLVAISSQDGHLLWTYPDGNMQLVLRDDGLYAMGRLTESKKFDYRTGKILAELDCFRGNCTRATGAVDSIFARGYRHTGTLRFDLHYGVPRRLPAMRPACQDGVIIANGQLYWGPWMCDCNHSLVGIISLASAGTLDFHPPADSPDRLETGNLARAVTPLPGGERLTDADWPTYRHDTTCSATTPVTIADKLAPLWISPRLSSSRLTAPTAVADVAYVGADDGGVTAIDSQSGKPLWQVFTGGRVLYPPTLWNHRLYAGSGDGWVYCLEAATGRRLWRFRPGPAERRIPVYGRLSSTWPVASGVLVSDGIAYAAAGIASHDGTYVCALDALSGKPQWLNDSSSSLLGEHEAVGVSVQGHLLLHRDTLHLAGGNVVSPARYDTSTGACLDQLQAAPRASLDEFWQEQRSSRGSELFLVDGEVRAAGRMLYAPWKRGPASRYNAMYLLPAAAGDVVIQGTDQLMQRVRIENSDRNAPDTPADAPDTPAADSTPQTEVVWQVKGFARTDGLVLCPNGVVVVGLVGDGREDSTRPGIVVLDPATGRTLWNSELPAPPARWGVAVDRAGRVLVSLEDGRAVCFGPAGS